jgi:hypothetical protein
LQVTSDTPDSTTCADTIWCPGRCNSAWRAAERRYQATGVDHDIEPREGQPVWCPPCTTAIRSAIADWPDGTNGPGLTTRLREEVESGVSAGMNEYVSGSKNRPVHDHEKASFLLDEFAEWIGQWEATIRAERHLAARKPTANPHTVIANACGFLLANLDWHLGGRIAGWRYDTPAEQIIEDFGLELLSLHRLAQEITGTQDPEPVRVDGVPCPVCDYKALEHEVESESGRQQRVTRFRYGDGEVLNHLRPRPDKLTHTSIAPMQGAVTGYIRCRKCRPTFRMAPDEYRNWTKMLAASAQVRSLATPEKLAEIFGNTVPAQYRALR